MLLLRFNTGSDPQRRGERRSHHGHYGSRGRGAARRRARGEGVRGRAADQRGRKARDANHEGVARADVGRARGELLAQARQRPDADLIF